MEDNIFNDNSNNNKKPIKITSDLAILLLIIIVFYFYTFFTIFEGIEYEKAEEYEREHLHEMLLESRNELNDSIRNKRNNNSSY